MRLRGEVKAEDIERFIKDNLEVNVRVNNVWIMKGERNELVEAEISGWEEKKKE